MYLSTSRIIPWIMWMTVSIFYAYQYILRVMPNIILDDLMVQFNFTPVTFGQFSGIYYIGYSLMHLPMGIFLDRYGPRNVMSLCILMTVVGMAPILFADHWIYPVLGRFLMGIGSSAAILGTFKIIRMNFKEEYFTRMLSFSVTIGLIGAIYGGAPISYMCQLLGYQTVVKILSITGLVLAGFTYLLIPNIQSVSERPVLSDIKKVLSNKNVLWLCILSGLMVGPLEGFSDVWGTVFFKHVYEFDATVSATLPSMIFIGMCFGGPILSFITEKTGNYLGTIIGSAVMMMIVFIGLISGYLSPTFIRIGLIIVGICSAYQILSIYKASTYVNGHMAGLTAAVANMIIMIFGYGFHSAIGSVIKIMETTSSLKTSFQWGIMVIPISLAISAVNLSIMMIKESKRT